MGLVGIWCMHFVGNRAIILGNGESSIQLVYNPGYTTLSAFLPIIGLTIAFSAAEYHFRSPLFHWLALICTGIFAGLSIVGMHYIGNFGVTNYYLEYSPKFVVASVVIAIGDCVGVLILFYNWRDQWITLWWKRLLSAVSLAGGVSAMHFTASTSCTYTFKHVNSLSAIKSRNIQVIVAGSLCGLALLLVLFLVYFTHYRTQVLKSKSQKIMLSCAFFDGGGRVLVTSEGVLPSRELTEKFNHRTFDDDFNTAHPVFHWIFRVSHNWPCVIELIPKMKSHLSGLKYVVMDDSSPASSHSGAVYDANSYADYSNIFRERFCTAAASLATMFQIPLARLGVLYDLIIDTGTLGPDNSTDQHNAIAENSDTFHVETGQDSNLLGKGQLMFLTRVSSNYEADRLAGSGFRWANIDQVSHKISQSTQIPQPTLRKHLADLNSYAKQINRQQRLGTRLSFFAMIPRAHGRGFDVAVKSHQRDQLPDFQLLTARPQPWHADFFREFDGLHMNTCVEILGRNDTRSNSRPEREQELASEFLNSIVNLMHTLPENWTREARFWGYTINAHYSGAALATPMYAFILLGGLHTGFNASNSLARAPLTFYNALHRCYAGSPDHTVLARDIYQEFGPFLQRQTVQSEKGLAKKLFAATNLILLKKSILNFLGSLWNRLRFSRRASDEYSVEFSMEDLSHRIQRSSEVSLAPTSESQRGGPFGGILVSNETTIQSHSYTDISTMNADPVDTMGTIVSVGIATRNVTFVDELMMVAKSRFVSIGRSMVI